MTEEEWLSARDLVGALYNARGSFRSDPRKMARFCFALFREVALHTNKPEISRALDAAERCFDGEEIDAELGEVDAAAASVIDRLHVDQHRSWMHIHTFVRSARRWRKADASAYDALLASSASDQVLSPPAADVKVLRNTLLCDIFGNPFRPVAFDPRWRTSDVVGVARAIYDDRAFERMPILADALMDAGCEDEQVISHCRSEGPHVRGCWVVDLALGKS